jgi:hypothetical protein
MRGANMSVIELEEKLSSLRAQRDIINIEIAEIHKQLKQEQPQPKNMKTVLFPIVKDFNVMCGAWKTQDRSLIFGPDSVVAHTKTVDIYDILVESGAFESKGQARKNWTGVKEIPAGWSEIGPIGKQKLMLFIWNPSC